MSMEWYFTANGGAGNTRSILLRLFSANTKHGFSCVLCLVLYCSQLCVCQDCFGLTQAKLVLSCGLILAPIKIFEGSPAYKLLDVHYASCYGWFIQQTMVWTLRYSEAHQTSTHNWLAQCMPGLSPPPHHFLHALVSALVQPPGCNSLPCRISGCPLLPSSSACWSKVCPLQYHPRHRTLVMNMPSRLLYASRSASFETW